jgi:DNA repair exonuclease SbcCD ATPase subunit
MTSPEEIAREIAEIRERWKSGTEYVPHGGQCYRDIRTLIAALAASEQRGKFHDRTAEQWADEAKTYWDHWKRADLAAGILSDPDKRHWKEEWGRQFDRADTAEAKLQASEQRVRELEGEQCQTCPELEAKLQASARALERARESFSVAIGCAEHIYEREGCPDCSQRAAAIDVVRAALASPASPQE